MPRFFARAIVATAALLLVAGCVDTWEVRDSGGPEEDSSSPSTAADAASDRDGQARDARSDAGGTNGELDGSVAPGIDGLGDGATGPGVLPKPGDDGSSDAAADVPDGCVGGPPCGANSQGDASAVSTVDCSVCASMATCTAASGQAVCTCPPHTQDEKGNGQVCTDKCELAKCSSNATCRVEGDAAKCACKAGFSGDGRTCMRDAVCADLGCSMVASCQTVSGRLQCVCPKGFQGTGVGASGCTCAPDHARDANGWCVHERTTNCRDTAPAHATARVVPTTITYTDAAGWSTPAACAWSCDTNYALENGACINTKTAACVDRAPANAKSTSAQVPITYTTAGGWSAPAACAWNCLPRFVRTGDTCAPAPCQRASAEADAYVDPVSGVDDALHGAGIQGCAFRTIAYALLQSRGNIHLAGGTHALTQTLRITNGQNLLCNASSPATLSGQPAIQGGDVGHMAVFEGGGSLKNCILQGEARGICIATEGAVTLDKNTISNCGGAAVHARGNGLVVTGNTINNGAPNVFFQLGGSATISANTFSATAEDVACNQLTSISGQGNKHSTGRAVRCRAECGCPAGF